jgi:hypothetical protein
MCDDSFLTDYANAVSNVFRNTMTQVSPLMPRVETACYASWLLRIVPVLFTVAMTAVLKVPGPKVHVIEGKAEREGKLPRSGTQYKKCSQVWI